MSKIWDEMTDMERLAVVQGLYKALGEKVSTKDPDSLRSAVDGQVMGFYETTGARSYDVNVRGQKVGTMSVTMSRETTKTTYDLADWTAFEKWASTEDGWNMLMDFAMLDPEKFCKFATEQTGEVPHGVDVRTVEVPSAPKGTTLRIDQNKVARALGNQLEPAIAGLLEG